MLHDLGLKHMHNSSPSFTERERASAADHPSCSRSFFVRFVSWCATAAWRTCADWRGKRPVLTRATAHLTIVALALTAFLLSGLGIPAPQAAVGGSSDDDATSSLANEASVELSAAPSATATPSATGGHPADADTIIRLPNPDTILPKRPRAQVITYTVQSGDNVFNIAAQFDLAPETIVWSNREALKDAPWLIQPGILLFILPVDGVYHTVREGETARHIADEYDVHVSALYNEWNQLREGQPPQEGQLLVVPGGNGGEVTWKPPQPKYAVTQPSGYSYGVCSGVSFTGPGANGWFILPTGSPRVSGWRFHDPRNPTHIGLDYACRRGDVLYAADNGVVTIAGWNAGYGILVEINHGNGFTTRYGHLSVLNVGCGQAVHQGDLIGYCGSTGWSTGAHLHFEIRKNGVPQDPAAYQP